MFKSLSRTAIALAATGMLGLASAPATAEDITFMTGPAGGSWYPLGGAIKNMLEQEVDGLNVTIRPGAGLINLKGVSSGKAEMAWSLVMSAVDGLNGNEPFDAPLQNICNLGSFYNNFMQVTSTDLSVNSVADLKGKSLATLPRGNTTELGARALLAAADLSYDDMSKVNFASISDSVNMMKDGQVDAMMTITSVPNGSLLDLTNSRSVKFVPIPDDQFARMKAKNAGWQRLIVKANSYPGQETDVMVAGFPAHLILHCEAVSEELAYNITKALIKRGTELSTIVKSLATLDAKAMAVDIGVPLHPGSLRAYKEAGAL